VAEVKVPCKQGAFDLRQDPKDNHQAVYLQYAAARSRQKFFFVFAGQIWYFRLTIFSLFVYFIIMTASCGTGGMEPQPSHFSGEGSPLDAAVSKALAGVFSVKKLQRYKLAGTLICSAATPPFAVLGRLLHVNRPLYIYIYIL
jgi:hypothetical protein